MSDLRTGAVKIVGIDSNGQEISPIGSTPQGDLLVSELANTAIVHGTITVGTSEVAARVGGSNLSNRKTLVINNTSSKIIYWGITGVTTSNGLPINVGEEKVISVGANITIFLISANTNLNVRIMELS